MKKIPLTQGQFALVNEEDFMSVSQYKWHAWKNKKRDKTWYASRVVYIAGKQKAIKLHNFLMTPPKGLFVDHINRNGLDNRRSNLRIVSHADNVHNQGLFKNNTSGFKGVYKKGVKWVAQIRNKDKYYYLGIFVNKKEAALAFNEKAKMLFGACAFLNKIE